MKWSIFFHLGICFVLEGSESQLLYYHDPPISTICGELRVKQANYRGYLNVTSKGYQCEPWEKQFPLNAENYPFDGLEKNNYCRASKRKKTFL